jgi:hypothetical protein
MLKKYEHVFSEDELQIFRFWFDQALEQTGFENKFSFEVNNYNFETDVLNLNNKNVSYCMERSKLTKIQKNEISLKIMSIVNKKFKDISAEGMYFVRVNIPSFLHIDEMKPQKIYASKSAYTYIIPLTFSDNISTVAFREQFDSNKEFEAFKNKTDNVRSNEPQNLISHVSYEHVFTFENHVTWDKGCLIEFTAGQVHCSSNFRPYHNYKDYILWHIA